MTAALDLDWERLHHRSRELAEQFTREHDPARQVAAARRIRTTLLQSGDAFGLRALRLATAAPMAGWLQDDPARTEAQTLGRLLAADQREAIPGLAHLEDELANSRGDQDCGLLAPVFGAHIGR